MTGAEPRHYLGVTARGDRIGVELTGQTAGGDRMLPVALLSGAHASAASAAVEPWLWPVPADLHELFRPRDPEGAARIDQARERAPR